MGGEHGRRLLLAVESGTVDREGIGLEMPGGTHPGVQRKLGLHLRQGPGMPQPPPLIAELPGRLISDSQARAGLRSSVCISAGQ